MSMSSEYQIFAEDFTARAPAEKMTSQSSICLEKIAALRALGHFQPCFFGENTPFAFCLHLCDAVRPDWPNRRRLGYCRESLVPYRSYLGSLL